MLNGVLWNLLLAAIPVALAYGLAWGLGTGTKQKRLPVLVLVPLALAWLVFLPNTCYLLTEWRHLLFDSRWADLLDAGNADRIAMFRTAKWAAFFLAYSGIGILLFVLAIHPVERSLRSANQPFYAYAPLFFFLMSLGVYLGLITRLNSWDLLRRPAQVWQSSLQAVTNPPLLLSIAVFGALLWALYEAVDIWVDGVGERVARRGKGKATPASPPRKSAKA
jgi:uncharacterized membrane protein